MRTSSENTTAESNSQVSYHVDFSHCYCRLSELTSSAFHYREVF